MDKKAKKRIDLLNQRLQSLKQKLSGAKRQPDEPGEAERLQEEIRTIEAEVEKLKKS